jgi:hypothetical protein
MPKYRIDFISSRGQPFGFHDLQAYDDADVIKWARKSFADVEMVIQCRGRIVAKLNEGAMRASAA